MFHHRPPAHRFPVPPDAAGLTRSAQPPRVSVLLTDGRDASAAVRRFRTLLPHAEVRIYDAGLDGEARRAAEDAGAVVSDVKPSSREALMLRMLAEADADIYLLAGAGSVGHACVSPLAVAAVVAGQDLVDLCRAGDDGARGLADRLLARTARWVFGRDDDVLRSDVKACSRRLAVSYRRTAPRAGDDLAPAAALTLHALRLRLPVGQVVALGEPRGEDLPRPRRTLSASLALLRIVARLLVEERPRRVFGVLGLAALASAMALAAPALLSGGGWALSPSGPRGAAVLILSAVGIASGSAGLLLDAMASARQEVGRVATAAIPRFAGRPAPGAGEEDRARL